MSTKVNPSQNPSPSPDPTPQPKKKKKRAQAFSDLLVEWEGLLGAVADHGPDLAPTEPHRAALAATLEAIKQTKILQDSHRATKQRTTQQLKAMLVESKDRAARLRGAIRAELGTGNEQLVQFGIRPVRRRLTRSQQSATATPAPPPVPEAPATKAAEGAK